MFMLLLAAAFFTATYAGDIVIVNTPDGKYYPEPCARTCAGATQATPDSWELGAPGGLSGVSQLIDISGCQFVHSPVVTATLNGRSTGNPTFSCPAVYTVSHTENTFEVKAAGDATLLDVELAECTVHWVAQGFVCE